MRKFETPSVEIFSIVCTDSGPTLTSEMKAPLITRPNARFFVFISGATQTQHIFINNSLNSNDMSCYMKAIFFAFFCIISYNDECSPQSLPTGCLILQSTCELLAYKSASSR